jgi:hypothetical protein
MTEGTGWEERTFRPIVPTDRFNMSVSVITVGCQVDAGHVITEGVMCNIAGASAAT